jgi:hypothetical protein
LGLSRNKKATAKSSVGTEQAANTAESMGRAFLKAALVAQKEAAVMVTAINTGTTTNFRLSNPAPPTKALRMA